MRVRIEGKESPKTRADAEQGNVVTSIKNSAFESILQMRGIRGQSYERSAMKIINFVDLKLNQRRSVPA